MFEKFLFRSVVGVATLMLLMSTARAVDIETVPVGNQGNDPDTRYETPGYGDVSYRYNIGKYEVTAGQYRDFLNAIDPTGANALGLYNSHMNNSLYGCQITLNPSNSPSLKYDFSGRPSGTEADWVNRPVNFVSFWDAARFANWLHNGQRNGDTENGAYHDIGDQTLFGRNAGARFFIPTEDEWYKAAYHDKSAGLTATYFDYPTGSNTVPGRDMTEAMNEGNKANYFDGSYLLIGSPYYRTEVGEFELSDSPYGTFDQGGNIWEWNETAIYDWNRGVLGGDCFFYSNPLHAADNNGRYTPTQENKRVGFRVASIPEPGSITLLVCGAVGLLAYGWRRRKRT